MGKLFYFFVVVSFFISGWLSAQPGSAIAPATFRDSTVITQAIVEPNPIAVRFGGGASLLLASDGALPAPLSKDCDNFLRGSAIKPYFDATIIRPITSSNFRYGLSLSYEGVGSNHTWAEYHQVVSDTIGGVRQFRTAEYDHTIADHSKLLSIGPVVQWMVSPVFSVELLPSVGLLFDKTYLKTESAISDQDLINDNGNLLREHIDTSGSLPQANTIIAALSLRAAYDLPLSNSIFLQPNITFTLPFNSTAKYWSHIALRAGVDLQLQFGTTPDTITTIEHIQIPIVEPIEIKKAFTAKIEVEAVGLGGKSEPIARLRVHEVKARNALPILNYIFFDSASSDIPLRYVRYRSNEDALRNFRGSVERRGERTMDLYLETLNILGDRLRQNPTATVRLIGSASSTDEGGITIAKNRAFTIRNYLHEIWNIDLQRIEAVGIPLPEKPSPNSIIEGQQENRRVEIVSNSVAITDPIYVTNIEHTANPPALQITQSFDPDSTVRYYRGAFKIGSIEVSSFEGDSTTSAQSTVWSVTEEALASKADSLVVELRARNASGEIAFARTSIKLEQVKTTVETEQQVDRFSLILFGFDESTVGSKNGRTVDLIAEALRKIHPKKITIIGYTDELGDDIHNNVLSKQRAESTAENLRQELRRRNIPLPQTIVVEGRGSNGNLYNNRLPEGRFLSRTVLVSIER